jgi:hypothetical protein
MNSLAQLSIIQSFDSIEASDSTWLEQLAFLALNSSAMLGYCLWASPKSEM